MSTSPAVLERFDDIDAEIVDVAGSIRILDSLTWPRALGSRFLEGWRAGNPVLPEVELAPPDYRAQLEALEAIMARCDRAHPLGVHLYKTACSYATAARMLEAVGTPAFTQHSVRLYGRPDFV
jgi:hypothetical protein